MRAADTDVELAPCVRSAELRFAVKRTVSRAALCSFCLVLNASPKSKIPTRITTRKGSTRANSTICDPRTSRKFRFTMQAPLRSAAGLYQPHGNGRHAATADCPAAPAAGATSGDVQNRGVHGTTRVHGIDERLQEADDLHVG